MANGQIPPLPAGFTLDQPLPAGFTQQPAGAQGQQIPPLPPGFALDQPNIVLEDNLIMAQQAPVSGDIPFAPGSKEDILEQARQKVSSLNALKQQPGGFSDDLIRATGLNIRAAAEGLASLPLLALDIAAMPINLISRTVSDQNIIAPFQPTFSQGLTELGLPVPETRTERIVSGVGRGATSVAGGFGAGQLLRGAEGIAARGTGQLLTAAPGVQVASGAGAGFSSEVAKEAGADVVGQTVAGLIGGLGSGLAASKISPTPPAPTLPGQRTKAVPSGAPDSEIVAATGANKIGLELNTLDEGLQNAIRRNADEAISVSSDLTPDAVARKAVYETLGIKPTRALITRSFDDALQEQNLLTEPEGAALRDIYTQNNQAIRTQIRTLGEDVPPVAEPQFGGDFRAKLIEGERRAQKLANNAFNKAVLAEGDLPTQTQPLVNYLQDNAAILNTTNAGKPVIAQLKQLGVIDENNMIPLEPTAASPIGRKGFETLPITLKELSTIRKTVNDAWRGAQKAGEGVAQAKLNDMRNIINIAENEAGGDLFKAYRTLRTEKGKRFENNPLIDDLISDRKGFFGTDKIEDSEVFGKAILRSSPEQFAKVWPRILPKARKLTQNQVAKYIEDTAFSNMGTNEAGDIVASAAKINRALNTIGPEKLNIIFGREKAVKLNRLSTAVREISNPPRGTVPAGSAPKLQFLTRSILSVLGKAVKVPLIGDIAAGTQAVIQKGVSSRENLSAIERAIQIFPVEGAAQTSILSPVLPGAVQGTAQNIVSPFQPPAPQQQQTQQVSP